MGIDPLEFSLNRQRVYTTILLPSLNSSALIDMAASRRYPAFQHVPLDTTRQSIHLVTIDPVLSPEGLVQCTIRHTTTNAQYNCLSYVWGS